MKARSAAAETIAVELRDLVRQAAGGVVGKTIAAQIRQAARNLSYEPESWRVREAWYGRAGRWHPAAIEDMRRRFAAWREREAVRAASDRTVQEQHIATIRQRFARLKCEVIALEEEMGRLLPLGADDG